MARYRIIQWRDLPSLVEAMDGQQTVRVPLSQRFQDLIDAVAMREGASESEAYLEGWAPGPETERPGDAETVAHQVASELEADFQDLVTRRFLGPPR
jgi:Virulence factor